MTSTKTVQFTKQASLSHKKHAKFESQPRN
jgi:hypothetical protein